ncbi:MAG: Nre family DNA repair protein [Desulfurococcaceae archaeon]|nr:Nre family DNA repair protein [Desulfurococcaceae archaeon]
MSSNLCILCRGGSRRLCGLTYCPIVVKAKSSLALSRVSWRLSSSTPPSAFVGWVGYPNIVVAAGLPPEVGDTSLYDLPERWLELPLDDVIRFRLTLVRGGRRVSVQDVSNSFVEQLREISLSVRPVDVEAEFEKRPRPDVLLDENTPPMGPIAIVKRIRTGSSPYIVREVEKVYEDRDLKARDAILYLYRSAVPISTITRILSLGALGLWRYRKLVPTRWAITAADSAISESLIKNLLNKPVLSEYRLYSLPRSGNLFVGIVLPTRWMFEWIEAWFPGSTWNIYGSDVAIEGDWELTPRRTTYPSIGGCYYASRLAAAEFLTSIGRQAGVVLYREIYPSFNIPVGVWFVREMVRQLFKTSFRRYGSLEELLRDVRGLTKVPLDTVIAKSRILTLLTRGRRLGSRVLPDQG